MATVLCVSSQKGGTGKSTTAVSLGVGLARQGKKVLAIDADPQSSMTVCEQSIVLSQKRPIKLSHFFTHNILLAINYVNYDSQESSPSGIKMGLRRSQAIGEIHSPARVNFTNGCTAPQSGETPPRLEIQIDIYGTSISN